MFAFVRQSGVVMVMLAGALLFCPHHSQAQPALKKVRVSIPAANVTYLPFYAAKDRGYYKDEAITLHSF
jgi:ABC-type nitrate/sulfonate/bicarbonate transport system substrate-binding protein